MSDEPIPNHKISVSFNRKVSDGNYGGMEASAFVQGEVAPDATADVIAQAHADLFAAAKAAVLDELGIPFTIDDNGVIREKQVPAVTRSDSPGGTSSDALSRIDSATGSGGHQLRVMNPDDLGGADVPDWLIAKTQADGVTAVWYNGHTATGNQPHWKEALTKQQRDQKVNAKGYWPPN